MNLYFILLAIFYVETINTYSFYGKPTTLERNIQISHFLFHLQVKGDEFSSVFFFMAWFLVPEKRNEFANIIEFLSTIWAPSWFRAKQEKLNFAQSVNCEKLKLFFLKNHVDATPRLDVSITNEIAERSIGRLDEMKQPRRLSSHLPFNLLPESQKEEFKGKVDCFEKKYLQKKCLFSCCFEK